MKDGCRFKIKKMDIDNYLIEECYDKNLVNKQISLEDLYKDILKTKRSTCMIDLDKLVETDDNEDFYDQMVSVVILNKLEGC